MTELYTLQTHSASPNSGRDRPVSSSDASGSDALVWQARARPQSWTALLWLIPVCVFGIALNGEVLAGIRLQAQQESAGMGAPKDVLVVEPAIDRVGLCPVESVLTPSLGSPPLLWAENQIGWGAITRRVIRCFWNRCQRADLPAHLFYDGGRSSVILRLDYELQGYWNAVLTNRVATFHARRSPSIGPLQCVGSSIVASGYGCRGIHGAAHLGGLIPTNSDEESCSYRKDRSPNHQLVGVLGKLAFYTAVGLIGGGLQLHGHGLIDGGRRILGGVLVCVGVGALLCALLGAGGMGPLR